MHYYFLSYVSVWKKDEDGETKDVEDVALKNKHEIGQKELYEDPDVHSAYKKFHFGDGHLSVPNFP